MRRILPFIVTFTAGIYMMLEYFFPPRWVHQGAEMLLDWGLIVSAFSVVLGLINIANVNLPRIVRRQEGWGYKVVLLVSLVVTLVISVIHVDGSPLWQGLDQGSIGKWIWSSFFNPASSTMFSLLAFFIASAAFRSFRARNLEASVMLLTGVIVMLGRVPIGEWLFAPLPQFVDWINGVPAMSARRAIMIGTALGAITTGLRIIFGIERSHLG